MMWAWISERNQFHQNVGRKKSLNNYCNIWAVLFYIILSKHGFRHVLSTICIIQQKLTGLNATEWTDALIGTGTKGTDTKHLDPASWIVQN
jgi:hypothetical protein